MGTQKKPVIHVTKIVRKGRAVVEELARMVIVIVVVALAVEEDILEEDILEEDILDFKASLK